MRLNEIEQRYDVVVASKLGRFIEHKDISAVAAKARLNDLVGDYQSDMFNQNPRAGVEWTPNGEGAKLNDPDLGLVIFIYMAPTGMGNETRRERALTVDEDKDRFVGNLKDPAAQEIADITNEFNKSASRGYSFNVYTPDKELATIIGRVPSMDVETEEGNLIEHMKRAINNSKHWLFHAWRGDVENEFAVYVARK